MNFNVLRDSCSESHFRGLWNGTIGGRRGAGIEVDDELDERRLSEFRRTGRCASAFYSLSALIISLSAKIHFENIFITKTNYIIASNKRTRMNKNRSVIIKS